MRSLQALGLMLGLMGLAGVSAADELPPLKGRTNLAAGRPVIFSPTPNYYLTRQGDTDAADLTDGRLTQREDRHMWFEPLAVGWSYAGRVNLAVDLGEMAAIEEIAIRFLGGSPQHGISFPGWVEAFVSEDGAVRAFSAAGQTSVGWASGLIVPIIIASLIILNTMLGSVYERQREISIYSSVGLAPSHVAALFIAASSVFAVVGAFSGYLLGQLVVKILGSLGWPGGINVNYSSTAAVLTSVIVMAVVLLSAVYPSKVAARIAVPDVTRRWTFPPPQGDVWKFEFPFTVSGAEVLGLFAYLARVFESYGESSIGEFLTEDVRLSAERSPEGDIYILGSRIWLAPYDLGISQEVELSAVPTGWHGVYRILLHIHRLSGDVASWKRINRRFLNVLRKRFLVWRTVPQDVKERYSKEGEEVAWSGGKNIA